METSEFYTKVKNNEILSNTYFLIIALLLAFGTLQFAGTVLATDKPVVSVVSCSMYPEYNVGDILFVKGQNFEGTSEDDVIVYDVRNKASIIVNSESYTLEASENNSQPSIDTEAGDIKLIAIRSDLSSDQVIGIVEFNSDRYRVVEGDTISLDGVSIEIESLSGIHIPIVHRVIEKHDNIVETKGDNNRQQLDFEKNVTKDQIHGKVFFRIPYLGNIKILAMDFTGLTGGQPFVLDTTPSCQERV